MQGHVNVQAVEEKVVSLGHVSKSAILLDILQMSIYEKGMVPWSASKVNNLYSQWNIWQYVRWIGKIALAIYIAVEILHCHTYFIDTLRKYQKMAFPGSRCWIFNWSIKKVFLNVLPNNK